MLDEREGEVPEDQLDQAFNRKPVLQRIAVVAAGPIANLLLAVLAYWFLFLGGESGYVPLVDRVEPDSVAAAAGLQPGQEIVAVDGVETPTWQALTFRLLDRIGDTGEIAFTVRYRDADAQETLRAPINLWLSDQEEPDLYGGLGVTLYRPDILPVVGEVLPNSPTEAAGFQVGDRILRADGIEMGLWQDWVDYLRPRPGATINVEFERDGALSTTRITPETVIDAVDGEVGRIGMAPVLPEMPPELIRRFPRGPVEALGASVERTWEITLFTVNSIKKMVMGLISPKNLSGPITIAKVATDSAKSGLESYIGFLALLSVSLGVLNLLPIPVLDGGHLLFYSIELLAGRPVPEKIQALGFQLGLFVVLGIMMLALYNDFARL